MLLVLPGYNVPAGQTVSGNNQSAGWFYNNYDLSARTIPLSDTINGGKTIANTLGELSKRENRFNHGTPGNNVPANFPFQFNNLQTTLATMILNGPRLGEDVILDNVLAFDVRLYDPYAQVVPDTAGTATARRTQLLGQRICITPRLWGASHQSVRLITTAQSAPMSTSDSETWAPAEADSGLLITSG